MSDLIRRWRKRPVVVEASEPVSRDNDHMIAAWCGGIVLWGHRIAIDTLEGTMTAELGDRVIRGTAGEFYPCKPDVFDDVYEEVTDE